MFEQSEVYRLNTDRFSTTYGQAAERLPARQYLGDLIAGGPDAAIEINNVLVTAFLDGRQTVCPGFRDIVGRYNSELIVAAIQLHHGSSERVVITGKWVDLEFGVTPYFDPYLVHVIGRNGEVRTTRYEFDIFPWDDLGGRPTVAARLEKLDGKEALTALQDRTELKGDLDNSPAASKGVRDVEGIIWHPIGELASQLPIVINRAVGERERRRQRNEVARFASPDEHSDEMQAFAAVERGVGDTWDALLRTPEPVTPSAELQSALTGVLKAIGSLTDPDDAEYAYGRIVGILRTPR